MKKFMKKRTISYKYSSEIMKKIKQTFIKIFKNEKIHERKNNIP